MNQGRLFDDPLPSTVGMARLARAETRLQRERVTTMTCTYRSPSQWGTTHAFGWFGPHHCFWCDASVAEGCRQFESAVARGEFDAEGYTPAERRAQRTHAKA